NLDSAVNTIEQYLYLYKMPGKSKEEKVKLHETRISLLELKRTLQSNLSAMNRSTYHSLDVEKEVIKLNRKRSEGPLRLDNELDRQEANMDEDEQEPVKADRGEENEGRK